MSTSNPVAPASRFWRALSQAVRGRGHLQLELARELRLTEPTLSRRIGGDGHLPQWPEVERVITLFALQPEQGELRKLWMAAVNTQHGLNADPSNLARKADDGRRLQTLERDREAVPLLEEAYRWLKPAAAKGEGLKLFTDVSLRLSAAYGNLGRYAEGLSLAQQCVRTAHSTGEPFLCFGARHQEALMLRMHGGLSEAYRLFAVLVSDYSAGIGAKTAGADAVARALRDGARTLVHDRARWSEAAMMQAEAARWAARSAGSARQQGFHTNVDRAALAVCSSECAAAERHLREAERALIMAHREGESWISHRVEAKYGLVYAAFAAVSGDHGYAAANARRWLVREEAVGNVEACNVARSIISMAEDSPSAVCLQTVLLR